MQRNSLIALVFSMAVLIIGFAYQSKISAAEETEILETTVGEPTLLNQPRYQNSASVSVSHTGVVAAFHPLLQRYRTSTHGSLTWGTEMETPAQHGGGSTSGTQRNGRVIKFLTTADKPIGEEEGRVAPLVGGYQEGWFMLHSTFAWFNDDFTSFEVAAVQVYMPAAVITKQTHIPGVTT